MCVRFVKHGRPRDPFVQCKMTAHLVPARAKCDPRPRFGGFSPRKCSIQSGKAIFCEKDQAGPSNCNSVPRLHDEAHCKVGESLGMLRCFGASHAQLAPKKMRLAERFFDLLGEGHQDGEVDDCSPSTGIAVLNQDHIAHVRQVPMRLALPVSDSTGSNCAIRQTTIQNAMVGTWVQSVAPGAAAYREISESEVIKEGTSPMMPWILQMQVQPKLRFPTAAERW